MLTLSMEEYEGRQCGQVRYKDCCRVLFLELEGKHHVPFIAGQKPLWLGTMYNASPMGTILAAQPSRFKGYLFFESFVPVA
jgi:hypothetical protein